MARVPSGVHWKSRSGHWKGIRKDDDRYARVPGSRIHSEVYLGVRGRRPDSGAVSASTAEYHSNATTEHVRGAVKITPLLARSYHIRMGSKKNRLLMSVSRSCPQLWPYTGIHPQPFRWGKPPVKIMAQSVPEFYTFCLRIESIVPGLLAHVNRLMGVVHTTRRTTIV